MKQKLTSKKCKGTLKEKSMFQGKNSERLRCSCMFDLQTSQNFRYCLKKNIINNFWTLKSQDIRVNL